MHGATADWGHGAEVPQLCCVLARTNTVYLTSVKFPFDHRHQTFFNAVYKNYVHLLHTSVFTSETEYVFVHALHEAPQSSVWEGGSGNHNTFHLKSIQEECLCKCMNQSYLRFIFIKYPPFISR